MTWHCPEWPERIDRDKIELEPGMSVRSIYDLFACNQFDTVTTSTTDRDGIDSDYYETDHRATCSTHDADAELLNEDPTNETLRDEIDVTDDIWVCPHCYTAFLADDYREHLATAHNEYGPSDETVNEPPATTHGTWVTT